MPGGPWPVELIDEDPMYDRFLRTLGGSCRLVVFDRPGVGGSDPLDPARGYFAEVAEAHRAVLDAVGAETAWIVGSALPVMAETIRAYRERISGAVLINPISTDFWKRRSSEAIDRQRRAPTEIAGQQNPSRADDPAYVEWLNRASRSMSSVGSAVFHAANRDAVRQFVADAEPVLDAPPTMLIRRRDAMTERELRLWQRIFPDAECVTIEGADSGVHAADAGLVAEMSAGFVTGRPVLAPAQRSLVAVLFTDLVDSTLIAAVSGDTVWRSTLDRYEALSHDVIRRHHGHIVKHTGDGTLATFGSGSEAVAAAVELGSATRDLGLDGRTGIHVGEIEHRDSDISGIAVNLAARIMGQADPGQTLVSSSVEQTTVGGGFRFDDLGMRTLKGIDRSWRLFAVDLQK